MRRTSRSWSEHMAENAERMLREAPRWLEFLCALPLVVFAGMIFFGVVAYLRFHQWYGRNLGEKTLDRVTFTIEALIAFALLRLAFDLVRGESRRSDHGLFSPGALRVWGVVFVILPFVLVFIHPDILRHPHLFFASWSAAAACSLLAARRGSLRTRAATEPPPPIE